MDMWDEKRWQEFKEAEARRKAAKEATDEAARQRRQRIAALRDTQLSFWDAPKTNQQESAEATPDEVNRWLTGFEHKEE